MKISCKCGRVLSVTEELAGKKVKCKACGQKYRLPPLQTADPTIQMKAWKDGANDAGPAKKPDEVGAVPLGESFSVTWMVVSIVFTLVATILGILGAKYVLTKLVTQEEVKQYADYIKLGMYWGPSLAFVVSGYIVARFSPGRTISEPAVGASLAVAIFAGLIFAKTPVIEVLAISSDVRFLDQGAMALKLNLFLLAMFNAALLACAGAYFGEVAQERGTVES